MKKLGKKSVIFVLMTCLLFALCSVSAFADAAGYDTYDYKNEKVTVTVKANDGSGYLYLRTGPGTEYEIISTIYDGTVLNIVGTSLDRGGSFRWGNTKYNGKWGWVSLPHTTYSGGTSGSSSSSTSKDVIVRVTDGTNYLYLRTGPSMNDSIICNVYDGTVLHITSEQTDSNGILWGKTTYEGSTGWVSMKHTAAYEAPKVTTAPERTVDVDVEVHAVDGTNYLYLRTGPSMNDDVICNIYDGEVLHITAEVADSGGQFTWGKTEYDGQIGWVSLKQTAAHTATPTPTETPTPTPTETPTPEPAEKVAEESEEGEKVYPAGKLQPSVDKKEVSEQAAQEQSQIPMEMIILVGIIAGAIAVATVITVIALKKNKNSNKGGMT